jgi:hypothetical protein
MANARVTHRVGQKLLLPSREVCVRERSRTSMQFEDRFDDHEIRNRAGISSALARLHQRQAKEEETMSTFASISTTDLVHVSGGADASAFDAFADKERARIADPYKQIVCTGAGVKGGPDLAKGVYGAGASDTDKIRAAEMLKGYCQGGAQLPAAAPKTPF